MNDKTGNIRPPAEQVFAHGGIEARDSAADVVTSERARRAQLRARHAHSLTRLMEQRSDLRGVNSLADFVDDSIRWTA